MRQEKKYYYSVEIEFLQFSFRNCETSRIWHEHLEKRKMKFSAFIGELAAQRVPSDVWHWRRLMRDASPPLPALLFSRDHACLRFKPGELLINNAGFFQQRVPTRGQNAFFNFVITKWSKHGAEIYLTGWYARGWIDCDVTRQNSDKFEESVSCIHIYGKTMVEISFSRMVFLAFVDVDDLVSRRILCRRSISEGLLSRFQRWIRKQ